MFWDARVARNARPRASSRARAGSPTVWTTSHGRPGHVPGSPSVTDARRLVPTSPATLPSLARNHREGRLRRPTGRVERRGRVCSPTNWPGIPNGPENSPAIWEAIINACWPFPATRRYSSRRSPILPLACWASARGQRHRAERRGLWPEPAHGTVTWRATSRPSPAQPSKGALLFFGPNRVCHLPQWTCSPTTISTTWLAPVWPRRDPSPLGCHYGGDLGQPINALSAPQPAMWP